MNLTGVFAPVPTPFDRADRVDIKRLRRALAQWLERPLTGFVVLGTTGEAPLVEEPEADRVIAAARETIPRERPLVVGTGRESTVAAVRAAKRAGRLGADAVLVRTPAFFKSQMTAEGLEQHYRDVADRSPVPVVLYNFTALTGVTLEVDAVSRLAEHPNIIGMKESGGDILQISDLASRTPGDFSVLSGSASTFHMAVSMGAVGGILALSCLLPDACVRLFALTKEARHDDARALQQRLLTMAKLVGSIHGIPGLKAALQLAGYDVGVPRRPLQPASEAAVDELRDALAALEDIAA